MLLRKAWEKLSPVLLRYHYVYHLRLSSIMNNMVSNDNLKEITKTALKVVH